jgi:hypothetical protein
MGVSADFSKQRFEDLPEENWRDILLPNRSAGNLTPAHKWRNCFRLWIGQFSLTKPEDGL